MTKNYEFIFFCVWIIKMTHFILTNVYCSPQTSDTHLSSSKRMKSFPLLLFVVPAMFFCPQLREWSHMNCPWPVGSLAPWAKWQGPAGWTLKLPNTFTADSSGPAGWPVLAVVGHTSLKVSVTITTVDSTWREAGDLEYEGLFQQMYTV